MKTRQKASRRNGGRATKADPSSAKGSRWSHRVMQTSNALDLEPGVFTKRTPRQIALSLKRSAEASRRRKTEPFRSAMSMLNFHLNRAGRNLTAERRHVLNEAKRELRLAFHRPE
jgi:Protein of unknown function (DUF3175)